VRYSENERIKGKIEMEEKKESGSKKGGKLTKK
jgi:hypothetical protein